MCSVLFIVGLFTGCPTPSEWDQQWQQVQQALQADRLEEAKELLEDILPSLQNNGSTDKRYGEAIFQLAEIARREEKFDQAESYYWKALPLIAESRGPEHIRMADPLTELATLYQHKEQPSVALPLLKRALAIREKSWGLSNKELLPTLKHYHLLLMLNDRHEEAVGILTRISHLEHPSS